MAPDSPASHFSHSPPSPDSEDSPAGDEFLPKVVSVDPAMFMPLDFDITEPLEEPVDYATPRGRADRARSMLETINFYEKGGRKGMLHLADMERRRILALADRTAALGGEAAAEKDRIDESEMDALIRNLEAEPEGDLEAYNVTDEDLAKYVPLPVPETDTPGRIDTLRLLQQVISRVKVQIKHYENHMDSIRTRWKEELEKELALLEEEERRSRDKGKGKEQVEDTATDMANPRGTPVPSARRPESRGSPAPVTHPPEDVVMVDD